MTSGDPGQGCGLLIVAGSLILLALAVVVALAIRSDLVTFTGNVLP